MTKLIRNLSFASFLAAASSIPSTGLQALDQCSEILVAYCLWDHNPPHTLVYACTPPASCGQMEECCEQGCEDLQLEATVNECEQVETNIAGECTCG